MKLPADIAGDSTVYFYYKILIERKSVEKTLYPLLGTFQVISISSKNVSIYFSHCRNVFFFGSADDYGQWCSHLYFSPNFNNTRRHKIRLMSGVNRVMIKAIIFDLDMCILDTHTLTGSFFQPVLDALYNSELPPELKEKINYQLWTTSLEDVVEMFSIPDDIAERMREAYRRIEVPDGIKTFGDEEYIRDLPVKKILVTTGYRKFQETKIEKLGIANLFDEIIIDALDYRDKRQGKKKIFEELLRNNGWIGNEVLVVGDNPISELGAAKSLGILTAQILRPTIEKWEEADYHIHSLRELSEIVSLKPS